LPRLALRRTRPLAAGAVAAPLSECAIRRRGARRAQPELHDRQDRGGGELPARHRSRLLRASLRTRVAARAGRGVAPLGTEVAARLESWLPKLHYPIRVGEHDQTAFAFGLIWDWAGVAQNAQMRELLTDAAQRFYRHDRNCPLAYEPSGEDFLSPCLAEADFMRRVLEPKAFAAWLSAFLPGIPQNT